MKIQKKNEETVETSIFIKKKKRSVSSSYGYRSISEAVIEDGWKKE